MASAAEINRRYERIDIELPCRLFIPAGGKGGGLDFQAYAVSKNLGLGGVFLESTFLLKPKLELFCELGLPSGPLPIRARIAHTVGLDDDDHTPGMGVEFLDVDAHGRETLLRYFTPQRYHEFYGALMEEFPHLKKDVPLPDVSLLLNLWEEWKVREEGGPRLTSSGSPPPPRRHKR